MFLDGINDLHTQLAEATSDAVTLLSPGEGHSRLSRGVIEISRGEGAYALCSVGAAMTVFYFMKNL